MATHVVSAHLNIACQGDHSFRDLVVLITLLITLLDNSLWKRYDYPCNGNFGLELSNPMRWQR